DNVGSRTVVKRALVLVVAILAACTTVKVHPAVSLDDFLQKLVAGNDVVAYNDTTLGSTQSGTLIDTTTLPFFTAYEKPLVGTSYRIVRTESTGSLIEFRSRTGLVSHRRFLEGADGVTVQTQSARISLDGGPPPRMTLDG